MLIRHATLPDGRSDIECAELEAQVPDARTLTGNLAMPGFTAPKLWWLREHEPALFEAITRDAQGQWLKERGPLIRSLTLAQHRSPATPASAERAQGLAIRRRQEAAVEGAALGLHRRRL